VFWKKLVGKTGEDKACLFLSKKGFKILERNFLCRFGEIDIVAMDGNTIVFVEVKTRDTQTYGRAVESITKSKLKKITIAGGIYAQKHDLADLPQRIDVLVVERSQIDHLENVTGF
jgi:putative endonuclease